MNLLLFLAVTVLLFLESYLFAIYLGAIFSISYIGVATEFKEKS